MTPRTSMPEAERVIARDYEPLKPKVLASVRGKLAGQGVHVDPADLDAVYNQAWHALYAQLVEGRQIDNPSGFLVVVAYRRAIEDLRSSGDDAYHAELDESVGREDDVPGLIDDQTRLRHLLEGMRERLTDRERLAAALCLIHGYSRPDAAEAIGVSRKRIEKIMDGVQRKLTALTADIDEGWCENRRSLISAYALGLLETDGTRHQMAAEHLRECSACRRFVATSRGLAAAFPPVGLPVVLMATGAGAGHVAAAKPRPRAPGKAVAAVAAVVAVLAAGGVALAVTGGSSDDQPASKAAAQPAASASASSSAAASKAAAAKAAAAAKTAAAAKAAERAKARAERRQAKRRAARRAAARAHAQQVAAANAAAASAAVQAASPPETTSAEPIVTEPPAAAPAPAAEPKPEPVVTDAAQEFGPEQNRP